MKFVDATNFQAGTSLQKVNYAEFYNHTLEYLDLIVEYVAWQTATKTISASRFSFCQYPFILSIQAKRTMMQKDSEHQMINNAKLNVTI